MRVPERADTLQKILRRALGIGNRSRMVESVSLWLGSFITRGLEVNAEVTPERGVSVSDTEHSNISSLLSWFSEELVIVFFVPQLTTKCFTGFFFLFLFVVVVASNLSHFFGTQNAYFFLFS